MTTFVSERRFDRYTIPFSPRNVVYVLVSSQHMKSKCLSSQNVVISDCVQIEPNKYNAQEASMQKYVCDVCSYVYDPEAGDPENGVQPGTAFEDIPDSWLCPICGEGKVAFSKE